MLKHLTCRWCRKAFIVVQTWQGRASAVCSDKCRAARIKERKATYYKRSGTVRVKRPYPRATCSLCAKEHICRREE